MESFDDSDLYGDLYDTVDDSKPAEGAVEGVAQAGSPSGAEAQASVSEGGVGGGLGRAMSPPAGAGLPAIPQQGPPIHFDGGFAQRQKAERDRDADTADAGLVIVYSTDWVAFDCWPVQLCVVGRVTC